jgi:acetate kinase
MNVFVINSGSSSIKYQLISMPEARVICTGLVDRIGSDGSEVRYKAYHGDGELVINEARTIRDHSEGLNVVANLLTDPEVGVISHPGQVNVVGHRVVHGGEKFSKTQVVTEEAKAEIKALFPLAPLQNPANYLGIEIAERIFTEATQVVVFDTGFHQSMPPVAYRMSIPNEYYEKDRIRSYGFHGTSHKYVSEKAAEYLGRSDGKIITIHLGNGCSISAVKDGRCMDTSMGFGPMNGLIMGTRAGDVDQSVIFYLVNQLGYSLDQVNTLLNKKSGMLGLTGLSDMRDIKARYDAGEPEAILAYQLYAYRIRKFIGSYSAILNGLDAIVFTAGVGENDPLTRQLVCAEMDFLGIRMDKEKNAARSSEIRAIHSAESRVAVLVIPTNEELEIAKQCFELLA